MNGRAGAGRKSVPPDRSQVARGRTFPTAWSHVLSGYEGRLAEAQRTSEAIRETLATLRATERGADGQITVVAHDAGNPLDLRLGNSLQREDGTAVAQEVPRVVRAAQSRVAA